MPNKIRETESWAKVVLKEGWPWSRRSLTWKGIRKHSLERCTSDLQRFQDTPLWQTDLQRFSRCITETETDLRRFQGASQRQESTCRRFQDASWRQEHTCRGSKKLQRQEHTCRGSKTHHGDRNIPAEVPRHITETGTYLQRFQDTS